MLELAEMTLLAKRWQQIYSRVHVSSSDERGNPSAAAKKKVTVS